jgi:dihydropteroate synthase
MARRPFLVGILDHKCQGPSKILNEKVFNAVNDAHALVREGADVIEVSVSSFTKDEHTPALQTEVEALNAFVQLWDLDIPLMIRTNRIAVAEAVLPHGGDILAGEVSLTGDSVARLCTRTGVALMIGTEAMQGSICPPALERAAVEAVRAGMSMESICLSLGRGTMAFALIKALRHFPCPLVISSSCSISEGRDGHAGTVAWVVQAMLSGVGGIRLHALRPARAAVEIIGALGYPC